MCERFFWQISWEDWSHWTDKMSVKTLCFKVPTKAPKARSFPCSLATACHCYIPCACVKRKFQFVTGGNWKSSKRHASLYSIVFGSLKSLPCIFCTNQTKQNVTLERIYLVVANNINNNSKTFQLWNTLPNSNWFDHLCKLKSEAIQHILTSRAGWKFLSMSTYYWIR